MAAKKQELFKKGDKVWARNGMDDALGPGPFFVNEARRVSRRMPCSKLHPQVLALLSDDRKMIVLFGILLMFPGSYFTKRDPACRRVSRKLADPEVQEHLEGLSANVLTAINGAEQIQDICASLRAKGLQVGFHVSAMTFPFKSLVKKNGDVPKKVLIADEDDAQFFRELHIRLE